MEPQPTYDIKWNAEPIGQLTITSNDMLYFEGDWTPSYTTASDTFTSRMQAFDPKSFFNHPERAERLILTRLSPNEATEYGLAVMLKGTQLSVRILSSKESEEYFFSKAPSFLTGLSFQRRSWLYKIKSLWGK